MQTIQYYLLKNRLTVVSNDTGFITEYRKVYQQRLKLYKGIDNPIQIEVKNADQKRVDIRGYSPIVKIFDVNQRLLFTKSGTINMSTPSIYTVTFSESDLNMILPQTVTMATYLSSTQPLYSGTQYDIGVDVEILDGFNDLNSQITGKGQELTVFNIDYGTAAYYSEIVPFSSDINYEITDDSAKVTPVTYITGTYSGIIVIEGTNTQSTAIGDIWTTIRQDAVGANQTINIDLTGNYLYIRFKFQRYAGDTTFSGNYNAQGYYGNYDSAGMLDKIIVFN